MYSYITQGIGFLGAITGFIVFQQKKRRRILLFQMLSCAFFVIHFVMLGAYTGAVMNAIVIVRAFVYLNSDKKWAAGKIWLAVFIIISVAACVITWKDWSSIFPLASMVLSSVSCWLKNEKYIRLVTFPSSPCWLVYNVVNGSVAGTVTEIFISASLIIAIVRYDILGKSKKQSIEVTADDS